MEAVAGNVSSPVSSKPTPQPPVVTVRQNLAFTFAVPGLSDDHAAGRRSDGQRFTPLGVESNPHSGVGDGQRFTPVGVAPPIFQERSGRLRYDDLVAAKLVNQDAGGSSVVSGGRSGTFVDHGIGAESFGSDVWREEEDEGMSGYGESW
ncbi:hypothetical protein HDU67_008050, partial [Dinochytrium kinnereticum]